MSPPQPQSVLNGTVMRYIPRPIGSDSLITDFVRCRGTRQITEYHTVH
jgi:hypothetical protein